MYFILLLYICTYVFRYKCVYNRYIKINTYRNISEDALKSLTLPKVEYSVITLDALGEIKSHFSYIHFNNLVINKLNCK